MAGFYAVMKTYGISGAFDRLPLYKCKINL